MYKEKDGVLYKLDLDGCTGGRLRWVESHRKTYKDTLGYKLWYYMPVIIKAGYHVTFALSAILLTAITIATFIAMYNALI